MRPATSSTIPAWRTSTPVRFAYRVQRGHGIDGRHDGMLVHNLLASYAHLRSAGGNDWPRASSAFVRRVRDRAAARGSSRPAACACGGGAHGRHR